MFSPFRRPVVHHLAASLVGLICASTAVQAAAAAPAATSGAVATTAAGAGAAAVQKGSVPALLEGGAAASAQAKKVLGRLVNAIRYEHDDKAAGQLDFAALAQRLLGDAWAQLSSSEQAELVAGLEKVIRRVSFVRGREVFKYLNAIRFEPAELDGKLTKVRSTVVIFRDLKKSEIVIDWLMTHTPQGPKVVDTVMLGESTADAIRDEQVKPLLAEGGVPALMAALRKKVAEVGG